MDRCLKNKSENSWPGLADETRPICEKIHLEDFNITKICKSKYVKMVNFALHHGDIAERFSDLTEDERLVQFFAAVLTRRDKLIQTPYGGNSTIVGANCVL